MKSLPGNPSRDTPAIHLNAGPEQISMVAVGFELLLKRKATKAGDEAAQGISDENPQGL